MTRRGAGCVAGLVLAACLALPAAVAQPGSAAAHVTRQGQAIGQLEDTLLAAVRRRERAAIEPLLAEDFAMIVAQAPDQPVDRDDWIDASLQRGGAWELHQLSVHDYGDVAVASFRLRPTGTHANRTPVFVVDTWRRDGSGWRLQVRHAALALGSRSTIPGDVARPPIPKKY